MCHQRFLAVRAVYWNSSFKEADDTCFPAVCPVFIRRRNPRMCRPCRKDACGVRQRSTFSGSCPERGFPSAILFPALALVLAGSRQGCLP